MRLLELISTYRFYTRRRSVVTLAVDETLAQNILSRQREMRALLHFNPGDRLLAMIVANHLNVNYNLPLSDAITSGLLSPNIMEVVLGTAELSTIELLENSNRRISEMPGRVTSENENNLDRDADPRSETLMDFRSVTVLDGDRNPSIVEGDVDTLLEEMLAESRAIAHEFGK